MTGRGGHGAAGVAQEPLDRLEPPLRHPPDDPRPALVAVGGRPAPADLGLEGEGRPLRARHREAAVEPLPGPAGGLGAEAEPQPAQIEEGRGGPGRPPERQVDPRRQRQIDRDARHLPPLRSRRLADLERQLDERPPLRAVQRPLEPEGAQLLGPAAGHAEDQVDPAAPRLRPVGFRRAGGVVGVGVVDAGHLEAGGGGRGGDPLEPRRVERVAVARPLGVEVGHRVRLDEPRRLAAGGQEEAARLVRVVARPVSEDGLARLRAQDDRRHASPAAVRAGPR